MVTSLKQSFGDIMRQLCQQWRLLAAIYLPLTVLLLVLTFQRSVSLHLLTADTASLADIPVYIGMLSNLGIVIWGAAFAICVFTTAILWGRSEWVRFFVGAGALTLVLWLDDMFMIHDRILPDMGIPEVVYVLFYAVAALAFMVGLRHFLRNTDYALLLIAVGLLGASVVFDVSGGFFKRLANSAYGESVEETREDQSISTDTINPDTDDPISSVIAVQVDTLTGIIPRGNISALAEDGTKFLGIAGWLLYLAATARKHIIAGFSQPPVWP